jgi:hypothetical protein
MVPDGAKANAALSAIEKAIESRLSPRVGLRILEEHQIESPPPAVR